MTDGPELAAVRAGSVEIAYREAGSGDPVFLINGTGESGATWAEQISYLSSTWRCVAIDNRDTGASTYVEQPYTPKEIAADAAAVIDALDLGPCHVVGYSLGGAAAQELALSRPDLVRSLVLLSTWARSDGWFRAQMRNWQSIRRAHWDDEAAFLRALAPWCFAPKTFDEPGRLEAIESWIEQVEPEPQRPDGWMRQTGADIAHDAEDRLPTVEARALVLVGDEDVCTPPRYSRRLTEVLPRAELVTVAGLGHCALFEDPPAIAREMERFLARA